MSHATRVRPAPASCDRVRHVLDGLLRVRGWFIAWASDVSLQGTPVRLRARCRVDDHGRVVGRWESLAGHEAETGAWVDRIRGAGLDRPPQVLVHRDPGWSSRVRPDVRPALVVAPRGSVRHQETRRCHVAKAEKHEPVGSEVGGCVRRVCGDADCDELGDKRMLPTTGRSHLQDVGPAPVSMIA
jgi:hypothetical protein